MQKKHVFLLVPVVGPPILTFLQLTETAFNGTMTVYDIVPMENELNLLDQLANKVDEIDKLIIKVTM